MMLNKFDVYMDHYTLQWLKSMRTGCVLLHHWSAALEEFDFTIHHCPGKDQGHVDGLSRLPVENAPPDREEATLLLQTLTSEEAARQAAQELLSATHVEALPGQLFLLWGQMYLPPGSSVMHPVPSWHRNQKTDGTIMSVGQWDTLSVGIVGPLPTDRRMEYIITFVDCYSKNTILIPLKDHTAQTVSNTLLDRVMPFFGVPRMILSDQGWKFTGRVWEELLPYHPEGNAINEQSHRTMNMLHAYFYLEDTPAPCWVDKIPAIMLTLKSMPHQPHGYSASMIATGQENTL